MLDRFFTAPQVLERLRGAATTGPRMAALQGRALRKQLRRLQKGEDEGG